MTTGDIAEGHRRSEIDAACGIVPAHDAGRVRADRIQARDRLARAGQNARLGVGVQPGEGAEAAGNDLDRVERPCLDGRHTGVGLLRRIATSPFVGGRAAAEFRILTVACMAIVRLNRAREAVGIDAARLS